jgi:CRP-like cAMP-binding protein
VPGLQQSVGLHQKAKWSNQLGLDESEILCGSMQTHLRQAFCVDIKLHEMLQKVVYLKSCPAGFMRSLLASMRPVSYQAGDFVLKAGSLNDRLYILLRGSADEVEDASDGGMLIRQISSGNVFGDRSFLDEQPQITNIKCITNVDVFYAPRSEFWIIASSFPTFRQSIENYRTEISNAKVKNLFKYLFLKM